VRCFDAIVIGGGMAGVSIGYELAGDRSVGLLENETSLAFHTTGRSAATFLESYGGPEIRALTTASRSFLENPPDIFEAAILSPLAMLWVGRQGAAGAVRELHAAVVKLVADVSLIGADEASEICPILRPGHTELAMLEPGAMEMDVHALHQGFVRGLRRRRGEVLASAGIRRMEFDGDTWTLTDARGEQYQAATVVNAAGAWADEVARMAGAIPVGIQPLRRTIFMVGAPSGISTSDLPMVSDMADAFYLKPEGEQFLCSPADETLTPPSDVRPDETEIARALEEINDATTLNARHVRSAWAGQRSFVADRVPVVGFDPRLPRFFWFAGQGGYGIQTAPALARYGASLIRDMCVPSDIAALGVTSEALAPGRAGLSAAELGEH